MAIKLEDHYPLSPRELFGIHTSMAFYERRYQDSGVDQYNIEVFQSRANGMDIHVEINPPIQMPDGIPRMARKLVPERQRIKYSAIWHIHSDDHIEAEYTYDTQGFPIIVRGKRTLRLTDDGTHNLNNYHVECNVPMFGNILAGIIEDRVRTEMEVDEVAIKDYIAQLQAS